MISGFLVDFGKKIRVSLNLGVASFLRYYLVFILRQMFSKSLLSSGSFILFCIDLMFDSFPSIQTF